jgi:ribonuclease HI
MKEWHIYIDGASLGNPGFAGAGMIAFDEDGHEIWRDSIHLGLMTNNMAEYEALVRALRKVGDPAGRPINVYTDSQLVAYQVLGKYRIKNEGLKPYLEEALRLMRALPHVAIKYIPREGNRLADKLAKNAAAKKG